jgi:CMP-N-acetylneuraminic acid synthetase
MRGAHPRRTSDQIVALVPMRHHSERVPEKNYRLVAGRPLYAYILDTLLRCPEVGRIVVDTDSPTIRAGMAERFPSVEVLERPEHLRAGEVPMNEILWHDVQAIPAEIYLQTHSTNPLLRAETLSAAIQAFRSDSEHDSLFGVSRLHTRLWAVDGRPLNHDPEQLLRTQDLPPVYEENSCLYIFRRASFLDRRNRIGRTPRLWEIDRIEAWDVDDEVDLQVTECLLARRPAGDRPKGST